MSKRDLYEVAIRVVGLFFAVFCIGYLGMLIQSAVYQASGTEYILGWAIPLGIFVLSAVTCLVFARRLAAFLSGEEEAAASGGTIEPQAALRVGLFLVGAYTLTLAIPQLVATVVRTIDAMREARLAGEFRTTLYGPSGQWISPLVRTVLGAGLIFYARIAGLFRRETKEQQVVDEP